MRLYGQALALPLEMSDWGSTTYCLEQLTGIAADEGDQGQAARLLLGAAEALLEGSEAVGYSHTPNRAAPLGRPSALLSALHPRDWASRALGRRGQRAER